MTDELKQIIDEYIELDWSPEQISGYLVPDRERIIYCEKAGFGQNPPLFSSKILLERIFTQAPKG